MAGSARCAILSGWGEDVRAGASDFMKQPESFELLKARLRRIV